MEDTQKQQLAASIIEEYQFVSNKMDELKQHLTEIAEDEVMRDARSYRSTARSQHNYMKGYKHSLELRARLLGISL